jgi:hypothetical protein
MQIRRVLLIAICTRRNEAIISVQTDEEGGKKKGASHQLHRCHSARERSAKPIAGTRQSSRAED